MVIAEQKTTISIVRQVVAVQASPTFPDLKDDSKINQGDGGNADDKYECYLWPEFLMRNKESQSRTQTSRLLE